MHSYRRLATLWALFPVALFAVETGQPLQGVLALSQALDFAMVNSPEIAAARFEVQAREGEVLQARLPDNPELGLGVENLDATGALAEENREVTTRLIQTLDVGRLSRASWAGQEKELARLELAAAMRKVRARVRRHFISVQAAQDRISLSKELVALALRAHDLAAEKVSAGKAPPTDSLQSLMALSQARIDSGKAAADLTSARRGLAVACGRVETSFDSAQGHLDNLNQAPAIPSWETVAKQVPGSPEWKRIEFGVKVRDAEVRSEKIARVPPIALGAGIRTVPDKEGRAFVVDVSLPLPAWDWNQGAIGAAKSRRSKAEAERRAERLDFMARLAALHSQASTSHQEARMLGSQILPAATATFEGAQEAYRVGKFGSLDALNAQRSLFEARSQYLGALESHLSALAELEELAGGRESSGSPENHAP